MALPNPRPSPSGPRTFTRSSAASNGLASATPPASTSPACSATSASSSFDRTEILSPDYAPADHDFRQFADLTQIAELRMTQLATAGNPLWMESAGAHILLYAGFFQSQNKNRHNIDFYAAMGRDCYLMAAVGKRAETMKRIATGFDQYLFHLANLHRHLSESRYLIRMEN